jgi:hypothetical protein
LYGPQTKFVFSGNSRYRYIAKTTSYSLPQNQMTKTFHVEIIFPEMNNIFETLRAALLHPLHLHVHGLFYVH